MEPDTLKILLSPRYYGTVPKSHGIAGGTMGCQAGGGPQDGPQSGRKREADGQVKGESLMQLYPRLARGAAGSPLPGTDA